MKTERILYHNYGEISYTAMIPQKPAGDLPDDYKKEDTRLFSSDDWRLTKVTVSEVRKVEMPEWMNAEFYCRNHLVLHWIWNSHKLAKTTLTEIETCAIMAIYENSSYELMQECVKLVCSNIRSKFRFSLKIQLLDWIEDWHIHENKYNLPFSYKQISALTKYSHPYRGRH